MMNDRFSAELRQHLLASADERPGDGRLTAIVDGIAVTVQRPTLLARLTWAPRRMGPFPSAALRYGLIALALIIAAVAAVAFASGQPRPFPPPTSGDMWPQSTMEEVLAAQQGSDAGDAAYWWQVDPGLMADEWWAYIKGGGVKIVERFLREKLGWDQFLFNAFLPLEYTTEDGVLQVAYVRCAPGKTNTLYEIFPEGHDGAPGAASCAPTIDRLHYETVLVDLKQPGQTGPTGLWVVERWTMLPPFGQADPAVTEAVATARLRKFLEARVAGNGAEGYVDLVGFGSTGEVPLLYATSTGAPYERFEFELVSGPEWPFADMEFRVRLFAEGGETVVDQRLRWLDSRFSARARDTTQNGQPVAVPYALLGGVVTFSAADPWHVGLERSAMELGDKPSEAVILVGDPRASGDGCGISPAPIDADALASSLRSDPDLEATDPVAANVGGRDALQMDIVLAPGASLCETSSPVLRLSEAADYGADRRAANLDPGARMRLYLVDLPEGLVVDPPEGSASRIVAIAIVAPEARFDSVLEAATPIIDSIEFKSGST